MFLLAPYEYDNSYEDGCGWNGYAHKGDGYGDGNGNGNDKGYGYGYGDGHGDGNGGGMGNGSAASYGNVFSNEGGGYGDGYTGRLSAEHVICLIAVRRLMCT